MNLTALKTDLIAVEANLGKLQFATIRGALRLATGARSTRLTIDGIDVPILRLGRGKPLVLVHGFADRGESLVPLAGLLRGQFSVIIPDLPGFGEADGVPVERSTMAAQARFLVQLLDILGLPSAHFAGHSMGGGICARLLNDHPQRVLSMTLIAAAGAHGLHPDTAALLRDGQNPLLPADLPEFDRLMDLCFASKPPLPRALRRHLQRQWNSRRAEHLAIFARMMEPRANEGVPDVFAPTFAPVGLIYGQCERVVHPDNIAAYAAGYGAARLVRLKHVGHAPPIEAPRAVAKVISQVADQVRSGGTQQTTYLDY
ncbi:MAG: alpha/beta fold hydrolase [Myxococcales bacterium]|nr:alpha/beta fold hydrolase [Myxococcales bacterium]